MLTKESQTQACTSVQELPLKADQQFYVILSLRTCPQAGCLTITMLYHHERVESSLGTELHADSSWRVAWAKLCINVLPSCHAFRSDVFSFLLPAFMLRSIAPYPTDGGMLSYDRHTVPACSSTLSLGSLRESDFALQGRPLLPCRSPEYMVGRSEVTLKQSQTED